MFELPTSRLRRTVQKTLPALCVCAAALFQAACSAPQTAYYRLPDSHFQTPPQTRDTVLLDVRLSESVAQQHLLYQENATQVHPALSHLWLGDIRADIAAALANGLNRQHGRYTYTVVPPTQPNAGKNTLTVYIDTFQGRYDGYTQIAGHSDWQGKESGGRNFDVRTPQSGNGYGAMVQSLSAGLNQVAAEIVR